MSRFTAPPFNKHSPFEFPRAPPSPPEISADAIGPSQLHSSVSVAGGGLDGHTPDGEFSSTVNTESPGARFRRVSSLAYHSSGLRDARERQTQRGINHKTFLIVLPPPTLQHEHGQLGHTLSFGPRHRISHGILMPLFPTMYAQLTAIAREFNFPSTAGLCLYLHHTENGITATPRISDETWQFMWGHAFEPAPALGKPPICGKVEFDLDLRQARWYASWIASFHQRESHDLPVSVPVSVAPSAPSLSVISHYRDESRTTLADDQLEEEQTDRRIKTSSTARHIPRKLSLVDRLDSLSIRSGSRPASHVALSPPGNGVPSSQVLTLSPIHQEDEPQTAKQDLDERVEFWRASSSMKASSLAATTGQTSLEPVNMPNFISLDDVIPSALVEAVDDELIMEDFTWSISSAGPNDWDPESPLSWSCVPSVHIAQRAQGSVCLTPSDCTSFGPSDYTLSPLRSDFSRPYSPDLAHRMYEEVPCTPTTATSWGPASVHSVLVGSDDEYAHSLDLGERAVFSRPPTPSTATSWGPSSWPASPVGEEAQYIHVKARSVHLADRGEFSRPVTPSTATTWGAPLSLPPSPATPFYIATPDAGHRGFEDSEMIASRGAYSFPYYDPSNAVPWVHIWPYVQPQSVTSSAAPRAIVPDKLERVSSSAQPWNLIWPYSGSNTTIISDEERSSEISSRSRPLESTPVFTPASYPYLNIYPAVYPFFDLYPGVACKQDGPFIVHPPYEDSELIASRGAYSFPYYDPFNAVPWAHTWPYRQTVVESRMQPQSVTSSAASRTDKVERASSSTQPWKLVWPYSNSNTTTIGDQEQPFEMTSRYESISAIFPESYPYLNIYPAVYPHFDLYPGVACKQDGSFGAYPYFDLYPVVHPVTLPGIEKRTASAVVNLVPAYPIFDLYPAVYPRNLDNIYPRVALLELPVADVNIGCQYPTIDLYPAIYPHIVPYPSICSVEGKAIISSAGCPDLDYSRAIRAASSVRGEMPMGYPHFNLYPSILTRKDYVEIDASVKYPHFDLYPSISARATIPKNDGYPHFNLSPAVASSEILRVGKLEPISVILPVSYPAFNLYPAAYPHFDLYPSVRTEYDNQRAGYPFFEIYPSVPRNMSGMVPRLEPVELSVDVRYPVISLYKSVYPALDIYPSLPANIVKLRAVKSAGYPHFSLYPAISKESPVKSAEYPNFDLYPAVHNDRAAQSAGYPHFDLYPSIPKVRVEYVGYPDFDLYPAVPKGRVEFAGTPDCDDPYPAASEGHVESAGYPNFNLYPTILKDRVESSGYPDFNLYTTVFKGCVKRAGYPDFDLYPAVLNNLTVNSAGYPGFDLYPAAPNDLTVKSEGYPYFDLYPSLPKDYMVKLPGYSHFDLHPLLLEKVWMETTGYPYFDLYPSVPQDRAMKFTGYPDFNLYPAAPQHPAMQVTGYPHFDLYPVVHDIRPKGSSLMPANHSPMTASRRTKRKTHAELHDLVFVSARLSFYRKSKPHAVLHNVVFPDGLVSTPSGTPAFSVHRALTSKQSTAPIVQKTPTARGESGSILRTSIANPTSPSRFGLPLRPAMRTSIVEPKGGILKHSSVRASSTSPLSTIPGRIDAGMLRAPDVSLSRANSLVERPANSRNGLDRSQSTSSLPPRPAPRKRDSFVLQRVKALNSTATGGELTLETLSKFPLPPHSSAPPVPKVPATIRPRDHSAPPFL